METLIFLLTHMVVSTCIYTIIRIAFVHPSRDLVDYTVF